ncbi:MAG: DUF2391 family protein [Gemmatimonadaceae bacterium]
MPKRNAGHEVGRSVREYGRGVAGGLLFSLPLLYTAEMWSAGLVMHPARLMIYVLGTFLLLLGYNRYVGLHRDHSWVEVAIDSVEEMGLGIILAAIVLFLVGRIADGEGTRGAVGQIVAEAMTVAIGVSVGTAQLGGGGGGGGSAKGGDNGAGFAAEGGARGRVKGRAATGSFAGQIVIALCGAVLFAANVAPTEEVLIVAAESSTLRLLGLAVLSLFVGAVILFHSGFLNAEVHVARGGPLPMLLMVALTYAVALVASAAILWFFGRFDGAGLMLCVSQVLVLGFVATLGASAGRLLLQ